MPCLTFARTAEQVLNYADSQHQFRIVGLVAALSFAIAWPIECDPLVPRNNALNLRKKLLLLRPYLRQVIIQGGQAHLFVHGFIVSHLGAFCIARWCPSNSLKPLTSGFFLCKKSFPNF